jgi:hypothetical protein
MSAVAIKEITSAWPLIILMTITNAVIGLYVTAARYPTMPSAMSIGSWISENAM